MRIDLFLVEKGFCTSRTEAKNLILAGSVKLLGKVILKPSFDVDNSCELEVDLSMKKYASRGGFKLEGALSDFKINVNDRLCIDVGASSGGFTDCLLKNGAKAVIAVDSGSGQLCDFLRRDERVIVLENYNARYMKPSDFDFSPSLAVMDVSFISATYIIPSIFSVLSDDSDFICLIKPQFEVGRALLGKGGIVKDEGVRASARKKVIDSAVATGFSYVGFIESPIKGGDGNVEYLAHFRKEKKQ